MNQACLVIPFQAGRVVADEPGRLERVCDEFGIKWNVGKGVAIFDPVQIPFKLSVTSLVSWIHTQYFKTSLHIRSALLSSCPAARFC